MDRVRNSKNRLTPLLLGILIGLIWLLIFLIIYKVLHHNSLKNIKKLKLDDDLVQELYMGITDDDLLLYTTGKYTSSDLPVNYIFKRATKSMTREDIEFNKDTFKISYDSLDSAIKMVYGLDFKYDLSKIDDSIESYIMLDDKYLKFNVKYDSTNNVYYGTYSKYDKNDEIKIKRELVQAYKKNNINLKIGYVIYKENGKYQICKDSKCSKIEKEVDSLDNYKYNKFVNVELKKGNDDVYYYNSSK